MKLPRTESHRGSAKNHVRIFPDWRRVLRCRRSLEMLATDPPWRCARRRRACGGAPRGGGKPASEREQTAGSATQPCHPDVLWLRTGVPVHSQSSSAHAWGVVPYSEAGKDCADGLASTVQCVQYSTADWLTATSLRSLGDEWQDGCR